MAICTPVAEGRRPLFGLGLLWGGLRFGGQLISRFSQLIWLLGYLLLAALLLPSLVSLFHWTSEREHYEHFPLLLAAAGLFAAIRVYSDPPRLIGRVSSRVALWTLLALAATAAVFLLPSRWMAGVAAWSLIAAAVAFLGGRDFSRRMAGPLLLLAAAAIPLPVNLDSALIVEMQHLATRLASLWLDLAGVLHFTSGVAIQTPGQDFFVEDACSGIHSLFAAIAVGVGYGVFREYRLLRVTTLVLQMIFWVVVANAVRVFLTVYGQTEVGDAEPWGLEFFGERFELGLGAGLESGAEAGGLQAAAQHARLGAATFAAGIGLAFCGDAFLRYLAPIGGTRMRVRPDDWGHAGRPRRWFDRSLPAWGLVIPGIAAISCAVTLTGAAGPTRAVAEEAWERVAVPRPEAGWGTMEETIRHAVRHWTGNGGREPGAGGRTGHPHPNPEAGEGTDGAVLHRGEETVPLRGRFLLEHPHPNPLPQAGEGTDGAHPQTGEGTRGPHPNPLPQAGEGTDGALLQAGEGTRGGGAVDAAWLPDRLLGWRKVGFRVQHRTPDDPFGGLVSYRWQYAKGNRTTTISLDGPYNGWHDLSICYAGLGWEIAETDDVRFAVEAERITARELQLTRLPLDQAQVLFACFDPNGRCVTPSPHAGGLWTKFAGRLRTAMQERPSVEGDVMQLQVLEEAVGERTEEAAEEIRKAFRSGGGEGSRGQGAESRQSRRDDIN